MTLMAEGLSNAGIAGRLHVTERCIEKHVTEILWKLNLFTGADPSINRRVTAVLRYQDAIRA
jgi:DNA-binding NarL/FixJ family response regulator